MYVPYTITNVVFHNQYYQLSYFNIISCYFQCA